MRLIWNILVCIIALWLLISPLVAGTAGMSGAELQEPCDASERGGAADSAGAELPWPGKVLGREGAAGMAGQANTGFAEPGAKPENTLESIFIARLFEFAEASDGLGDDVVYNEGQLADWCGLNDRTGGTVYLGCDIVISEGFSIFNSEDAHITIDTGGYGLFFDGAWAMVGGSHLTITGEGVDKPVVTLCNTNSVPSFMGNWNTQIQSHTIIATGNSAGIGGVALRVLCGDGADFSMNSVMVNGLIRSSGKGAVGLELDAPLDVYCLKIEVDGEDCAAVKAPDGTVLYFCRLFADGDGAVAVSGGDVTLDACTASPGAPDIIDRRIEALVGSDFYIPVRQHGYLTVDFWYTFLLRGSDGSVRIESFSPDLDWAALSSVDTAVLGKTSIDCSLFQVFDGFGLCDDYPLTLVIDVRDADIPCIERYFFDVIDPDAKSVSLQYWGLDWEADEKPILWRSEDGGDTWVDYTYSDDVLWFEVTDLLVFHFDSIASPIMFQLEMPGRGESNVITLMDIDGVPVGNNGGDRTGADRIIGGKPSSEPDDGDNRGDSDNPDSGKSAKSSIRRATPFAVEDDPGGSSGGSDVADGNGTGGDEHIGSTDTPGDGNAPGGGSAQGGGSAPANTGTGGISSGAQASGNQSPSEQSGSQATSQQVVSLSAPDPVPLAGLDLPVPGLSDGFGPEQPEAQGQPATDGDNPPIGDRVLEIPDEPAPAGIAPVFAPVTPFQQQLSIRVDIILIMVGCTVAMLVGAAVWTKIRKLSGR